MTEKQMIILLLGILYKDLRRAGASHEVAIERLRLRVLTAPSWLLAEEMAMIELEGVEQALLTGELWRVEQAEAEADAYRREIGKILENLYVEIKSKFNRYEKKNLQRQNH